MPFIFAPERVADSRALLEEGAARAGRSLNGFNIAPTVNLSIDDDVERAWDTQRTVLALYVGGMGSRDKNFYNQAVQRLGFEDVARKVQDLYLDGKKEEAAAALPGELIDKVTLCGPPDRIKDRLQAYRDAGVGTMVVTPMSFVPDERVKMVRQLAELL
jgi:alkanesulfonate monooxygenase SsuD/methylene tetrahydromethanopterin reductase-like flavin-dependent oxidoreductase (luciferase family)